MTTDTTTHAKNDPMNTLTMTPLEENVYTAAFVMYVREEMSECPTPNREFMRFCAQSAIRKASAVVVLHRLGTENR